MGDWHHSAHYTEDARRFRETSSEVMVRHFAETVLPALRVAAHDAGYALAIHGSLKRDFDLIACPWVEDAKSAPELIQAICDACRRATGWGHLAERDLNSLAQKPHGRVAAIIHGSGHVQIDLSVMPRLEKPKAEPEPST